jgi:muramidase (phage lysozyme)
MERKQIDDNIRQIDLQPIAAPIQSFAAPGPSPLRGLAEGLSKLDAGLKSFEDGRAKKQADDDKLRGQAQFYKDNDGHLAELVRSGKIPAQWSPGMVNGFKAAQGTFLGTQLQSNFQDAYDKWDGKNSEDPKAYETFVHTWMAQNIPEDTDPHVLKTLLPQIGEAVTSGANRHIEDRHKAVYGGMVDTTVANIGQDVDKANSDGLSVPEGTNYPALWDSIAKKRQASVDAGVRPEDLDLGIMNAMSAKILTTRDPELLKFFDQKVPGKDYTYGESPDGIKIKKETLDSLDVINRRNISDASEAQKAIDREQLNAAKAEAGSLLAHDPTKPLPEALIERGSKLDGDFRATVEGWRDSFAKGMPSDPDKLRHVYSEMYDASQNGGDPTAIARNAASQGVFTNPEDASKVFTMAEKLASNKDAIKGVFEDQSYKTLEKVIAGRTQSVNDFTGDPMVGMSNEGLEAQYDLRQKATEWALSHPNATSAEQAKAVSDIGKTILDSLQPPPEGAADNGSGLIYNRDQKQFTFPNPYAPDATAQPTPTPAPAEEAPAAPVKPPEAPKGESLGSKMLHGLDGRGETATSPAKPPADDGSHKDILGGLTAEQRKSMEERAKAFGLPVEEYVKRLTAPKQQSSADGVVQNASFTPAKEMTAAGNPVMDQTIATKLIDESFTDSIVGAGTDAPDYSTASAGGDPKAGRLLGLIRQHEAAGNYNAVYGNARNTTDLGKFSLNQILAMQAAARSRGVKSTAIGGYQFIYKTLRGLKDEMKLTGDEKFTPELQDRLGMALLQRRGYEQFKAGTLSKRGFALRIAQEWASLPDPNTGRSVYAGDGLNASSVRPRQVLAELGLITEAQASEGTPNASTPVYTDVQDAAAGRVSNAEVYANIPDTDETGNGGQRAKFAAWNPDPIGNNEKNLSSLNPQLADVAKLAQQYAPDVQFVVGMGKRTPEQQKQAIEWGWSKTEHSDHLTGSAVDLWPIVDGKVKFDPAAQKKIAAAMKKAAKKLGVQLDVGADWKKFKDLPHFALKA